MNTAPVLRCNDWKSLLPELFEHAEYASMSSAGPGIVPAVLAAPAAIARWVAVFAPELVRRDKLSILVIGAESTDAPDQGRWYQTVAAMLAFKGAIEVTLVGAELDITFASSAASLAPAVPANSARQGLAEFLAKHDGARFDLAVLFQPGFQKHRGWLQDSGIARLLAAGALLMGTSYSTDEYQMERWVLECHGYRVSAESVFNPFFLELGDANSSIQWGRALWQIESTPARDFSLHEDGLAALDLLTRMVLHSITVIGQPSPECGAMVELSDGKGRRRSLLHIFDRRFVDPADGSLLQLADDGGLKAIGALPATEIAQYPRAAQRDIERAMWAAGVKSRFLLAGYPAVANDNDGVKTARGMFNDLRARAARLFR